MGIRFNNVGQMRVACLEKVLEIKFERRDKSRVPKTRRMLCTLDFAILDSPLGKQVLKFRKPKRIAPYDAAKYGLCTVWDIIMQDWRNVPVKSVDCISQFDTRPQKKFWDFFENVIKPMSKEQRTHFMDQ